MLACYVQSSVKPQRRYTIVYYRSVLHHPVCSDELAYIFCVWLFYSTSGYGPSDIAAVKATATNYRAISYHHTQLDIVAIVNLVLIYCAL
jgi:hypothetical protein